MTTPEKIWEEPERQQESELDSDHNFRGTIEFVLIIVTALVIALIIRMFLLQVFFIPSPSMDPYLKVNDKILVNKLAYKFHDVERGDVVVFDAPKSIRTNKIKDLVKRVVALPGETVEGRCPDGETSCELEMYINGKKLEEPYLVDGIIQKPFGPVSVPSNSIFVMGDNRDDSEDSRFFGPIAKSTIVGRAFFRIWPGSGFGFLQ